MSESNLLVGLDIAEGRITRFLTTRGLCMSDLLQYVDERINPTPEAIVFCSGSALDGFANATSDLDVFIISKHAKAKAEFLPITNAYDSLIVDTEYWTNERCSELLSRLREVALTGQNDPRIALTLSKQELDFLHRVKIGHPLLNDAAFRIFQDQVKMHLQTALILRSMANYWPFFDDLIGVSQEKEQTDTCVLTAHRLVELAFDMTLQLIGETNPSEKWRLKCLKRASSPIHPIENRVPQALAKELRRLLCMEEATALPEEYCWRAAWLARSIYLVCQLFLNQLCDSLGLELEFINTALLDDEQVADDRLPCLRLDILLNWCDGKWFVQSHNSTSRFWINNITLKALALFNGITTTQRAAEALTFLTPATTSSLISSLEDLRLLVIASGLATEAIRGRHCEQKL